MLIAARKYAIIRGVQEGWENEEETKLHRSRAGAGRLAWIVRQGKRFACDVPRAAPHRHLTNVLLTSAAPYRKLPVPSLRQRGCQIDLLIQSRRTLYIVEIKRRSEIGRDIIEEVDAKVRCLKPRPNVSIRTALVYDGHLAPIVEADGYFDAIIPFRRLLNL